MNEFIENFLSVTTAEEESNYFHESAVHPPSFELASLMPPGFYRVIAGKIYRILPGASLVSSERVIEESG